MILAQNHPSKAAVDHKVHPMLCDNGKSRSGVSMRGMLSLRISHVACGVVNAPINTSQGRFRTGSNSLVQGVEFVT